MSLAVVKNKDVCPRSEIAAYLDGELSASDELYLEQHFAVCGTCLAELNSQKKLLSALDFAFEKKYEEVELPENFTKVVVAKAECGVSGLRSKRERFWAMCICSILLVLPLVGLGTESSQLFATFTDLGRQIFIVAGFVNHLIFDVTVGLAVIFRSLSQKVVLSPEFLIFSLFCFMLVVFFAFSRGLIKFSRS